MSEQIRSEIATDIMSKIEKNKDEDFFNEAIGTVEKKTNALREFSKRGPDALGATEEAFLWKENELKKDSDQKGLGILASIRSDVFGNEIVDNVRGGFKRNGSELENINKKQGTKFA